MGKESIEGSDARAADRGRDFLFEDSFRFDQELSSVSSVEAVVRQFLTDIVSIRQQYNSLEKSDSEAKDAVRVVCRKYADLFMGRAEGQKASQWNSVEQLGRFLSSVMSGSNSPESAAEDFFLYLASEMLNVLVASENDQIDDDIGQFRVNALAEDAVNALLGLPANAAEEE